MCNNILISFFVFCFLSFTMFVDCFFFNTRTSHIVNFLSYYFLLTREKQKTILYNAKFCQILEINFFLCNDTIIKYIESVFI